MRDRNRRPKGVNVSRLKFLPKSIRRPISQNHHKPSRVLDEVWNSYGRAKPTQTGPRTSERKLGSKRKKQQTWQTQTGQTACSDRSGWKKNSQTGQTGFFDRSDRSLPESPQSKLQMVNLDQMKSKFDETREIPSHLPRKHIPKRSFPKD